MSEWPIFRRKHIDNKDFMEAFQVQKKMFKRQVVNFLKKNYILQMTRCLLFFSNKYLYHCAARCWGNSNGKKQSLPSMPTIAILWYNCDISERTNS